MEGSLGEFQLCSFDGLVGQMKNEAGPHWPYFAKQNGRSDDMY